MLRSTEASGKAGVYGLRYLSQGTLEKKYFHKFVRNEMLRREYLNQTFQVLPELKDWYNKIVRNKGFEQAQRKMFSLEGKQLKVGDIYSDYIANKGKLSFQDFLHDLSLIYTA